MKPALTSKVVVVTGASHGIGQATALQFARHGCRLVLGARNAGALHLVSVRCKALGAQDVVAVSLDVSVEREVDELAALAVRRFGRIDVWVNNAAVLAFGRFDLQPTEAFRRVVEVNLFGYVHGSRAALLRFRAQRRGILINNASILAVVPWPFASAYVTTKHAIRGLSASLRAELLDCRAIRVCTVLPASIDTAIFQRAANYTGQAPRAVPPVYGAATVARSIVRLATKPRRETFVGTFGRLAAAGARLAPGLVERLAGRFGPRLQFRGSGRSQQVTAAAGNLFQPLDGPWTISGDWTRPTTTAASIARASFAVLLIGVGLAFVRHAFIREP